MGSGSSKVDKAVQMPLLEERSEIQPQSERNQGRRPPRQSPDYQPTGPSRRPRQSMPSHQDFDSNIDMESFSQIWQNGEFTSTFQQWQKKNQIRVGNNRKQTRDENWTEEDVRDNGTAHVESVLKYRSHECIASSSTEKVDVLIAQLKKLYEKLDINIRTRTEKITTETQLVLDCITMEAQRLEAVVVSEAKEEQHSYEVEYRATLQKLIAELDEMLLEKLTKLQATMSGKRVVIVQQSQRKIDALHAQANAVKTELVYEEQMKMAHEIQETIEEIKAVSSDVTLQHLGSEITTKIDLIMRGKVGTKAHGQECDKNLPS